MRCSPLTNNFFALFAVALCASILLSGCSGSNKDLPTRPLYSGSEGIIVSLPKTNALTQYQGDLFSVSVRLLNDGTADLSREKPGILTAAFDSSVINAREVRTSSTQFTSSSSDAATSIASATATGVAPSTLDRAFDIVNQLVKGTIPSAGPAGVTSGYARAPFTARGRNRDMPVGDIAFVEFTFDAKKQVDNRQRATTPLTLQACYPYTTTFIADICVDRDILNGGSGGGCNAATINAQPQGAPIAVRSVTPRYTRVDGGVQARYEITLENVKDGLVIWPGETLSSVDTCDLSQLKREYYGRAVVTGQVTATLLRCGTDDRGIARFDKKSATIICRLDAKDMPPGFESGSNYAAPLILQVRYFYIQTTTVQLEVVKQ